MPFGSPRNALALVQTGGFLAQQNGNIGLPDGRILRIYLEIATPVAVGSTKMDHEVIFAIIE